MARQLTFEEDGARTPAHGVDPFEAKSALQKSIRRGMEEDALYWAVELLPLRQGESLWNRLKVIASEDVGLAAPTGLVSAIRALYENWKEAVKDAGNLGEGKLFITHAVLLLVRAEKSRIIDHATILAFNGGLPERPVPDYALDKHTPLGKTKGRGVKHFFEEGAKLENESDLPDPYRDRAKKLLMQR